MSKLSNMNNKRTTICVMILLLLFAFVSKDSGMLYATTIQDNEWSFEFIDLSVPEILNEIHSVSGVEIVLKGDPEARSITKSYIDYTIDNILLDVFRNENLAALFNYDDKKLAAIKIWILPEGMEGTIIRDYSYNNPTIPVTIERHQRVSEYLTRSRINNAPNLKDKKSGPSIAGQKNNPFVSLKREDAPASIDDLQENDPIEENQTDPETTNVIPVPDIITKFGLELPPMPPGLSFN